MQTDKNLATEQLESQETNNKSRLTPKTLSNLSSQLATRNPQLATLREDNSWTAPVPFSWSRSTLGLTSRCFNSGYCSGSLSFSLLLLLLLVFIIIDQPVVFVVLLLLQLLSKSCPAPSFAHFKLEYFQQTVRSLSADHSLSLSLFRFSSVA